MKKSIFFGILMLVVLLSLAGANLPAAKAQFDPNTAASLPNPASSPWFISWLDRSTSTNVGAYPSMAYSPIDNLPYVSYYDAVNGDLVLASPVPNGGSNCGVGGDWWCRAVDGSGVNGSSLDNVGTYSSADFWQGLEGSTPVWKFGIAYHDVTNRALKYAVFTQYPTTWSWDFQTILSTSLAGSDVGLYNSLKYASDGRPKIAFYQTSALTGSLTLAYAVSAGGNCGEGVDLGMWSCDMVDSGAGVGQFASLSIDYNQSASMAYYDGANGNLKYAYYYGFGGGNCGVSNTYHCETVDEAAADVGRSAALVAPRSLGGPSQIAYYDRTNGKLKHAFEVYRTLRLQLRRWQVVVRERGYHRGRAGPGGHFHGCGQIQLPGDRLRGRLGAHGTLQIENRPVLHFTGSDRGQLRRHSPGIPVALMAVQQPGQCRLWRRKYRPGGVHRPGLQLERAGHHRLPGNGQLLRHQQPEGGLPEFPDPAAAVEAIGTGDVTVTLPPNGGFESDCHIDRNIK